MSSEILLIPVGSVDLPLLKWLTVALSDSMRLSCEISEQRIEPAPTFHPGRQQYHSTQILAQIADIPASSYSRLLGVASVDLFIPILTFVFGEAQLGRRAALMSVHRLHQSFYGLPEDERIYYERAEKEAMHELGHTFGLIHCKRQDCVMHFSNSIEQVDLKPNAFCLSCEQTTETRRE